jgi:DNA-binding beta-propeller fold protein YncE
MRIALKTRHFLRYAIFATLVELGVAGCTSGSEHETGANSSSAQDVPQANPPEYTIDTVPLPGDGRGDYITVDPVARRLYVTHTEVVHVLDLDSLKVVAEIGGLGGAHGVAVVPQLGRGFISDGRDNQVLVFDLATDKIIGAILGGKNPDAILYDPASGLVFAFNGTSQDASVIDPAKAKIVKVIPLGDKPEFSRADGKGLIFTNLEGDAAIAVIDTKTLEVLKDYKLPDCGAAAAMAFDDVHRRIFSGCESRQLKVVDADSGEILASLPIGEDADGAAFDPQERKVFVANRDGTMTVIRQDDADHYEVEQDLHTEEYAKTIAIDLKTQRIFSSTAELVWPKAEPGKRLLPDAKPGTFRLLVISRK